MITEFPRLFIAISIDEGWRIQLAEQVNLLQHKLPFQKWVHLEDYHITLKFLGEASVEQFPKIQNHLAQVSKMIQPFELTEKGWGTFGPLEAPNILWAGVGGDLDSLNKLQQHIDHMEDHGFPKENRKFHPHLTIARRYKGKAPLAAPIEAYLPKANESIIKWSVTEIKLYQSHVHKSPMYEPLDSFTLSK
ncbi:RNA 2',3'-cyclic phosphodiesterase [Paenibacillus agricola]|uniref:RNA 2',3'-cyclic phosphodiesterase n=1 Tax=Paenibacillus agricola TaxID=2716264 RepID=A0ABX0JHL4_9BACL|nr:RNA 2',3'-cyclic phosphodiesterase [Paenibacillus agricola]NHN34422.1 RNA 2',3'-cyclic phosphodiesterase [Paenibacillus agricola]